VWAISAVVGPMAGGLIIRDWSWAWIFWMNVPIGLASIALFVSFLHEEQRHQRPSIDIPGAILFTVAIAALMIALTEAGTSNYSDALIACAVFVVGTFLFVAQERRAADPMISFSIWSRRPIASANGIALLSGMALMGLTTFCMFKACCSARRWWPDWP
jgi:MFS family permease